MKAILLFCILLATAPCFSQTKANVVKKIDNRKPIKVVEVSCGQCQFKMAGKGCNLAVRINGKSYFVDGTSIDEQWRCTCRRWFL